MSLLIIAGSSRKASINRRLQQRLAEVAQSNGEQCYAYAPEELDAPLYNGDYEDENGVPTNIQKLASAVQEASKIIVVTPEYNASIPPLLKNAIDWSSRLDTNPWTGKTVLLAGASPGQFGAVRSMNHLRSVFANLGAWVAPAIASIAKTDAAKIAELDAAFLTKFIAQGD
ncbi:Chromate reductase [Pseudidiomarina piscicola]|uniref:Chromate reductase n=1 Tax=Pseudidiomarina piscicola TaxID=2614830 RepID=A0A6S6WQ63_9GAMM|nr:NAD(P)H-dependent oxidoreductase [Pseudidiomarina piscicola]CAB0151415.1 Chromate reductase [Pseudidiomarina piscicola]VZT40895.1 Chromate reductase [Pseudomonas aeruginosa]